MTSVRKAVILAAGLGSRLGSQDEPKPLTSVNGVPILHRALRNLRSYGIGEAVIVVGHRADEIVASVGSEFCDVRVTYVRSDKFPITNNAYSLWLAQGHLDEDVFLLDADVVFDGEILGRLARVNAPLALAVAPWREGMDGTAVRVQGEKVTHVQLVEDQAPESVRAELFKTVNVSLLRLGYLTSTFLPSLETMIGRGEHSAFYDAVIAQNVARGEADARAVDCGDLAWQEVDDLTDLAAAEYRFGTVDERLETLRDQCGGYWRYEVTDHCLLYNPHFPPEELWQALAAELRDSLIHYPVGQRVLGDLLSAVVGQPPERLAVANGASELIKILGRILGEAVVTVPGFNEYESAFLPWCLNRVELAGPGFQFDVGRVHRAVLDAGARAVVVTSPNNPTGLATSPESLLRLCKLLAPLPTRVVLDESFIDFCDGDWSLEPHLADHPNLVIVKSMSKVYGLGGLRLGYLASADNGFVSAVRDELPIWNVNGLAEAFLRHLPRFTSAFRRSLDQVRADRAELCAALSVIDGLHVLRSDANFVMMRLEQPWSGPRLVRALLARHGILIKDCAGKSMRGGEHYVRASSRTSVENRRLVAALKDVLSAPPV